MNWIESVAQLRIMLHNMQKYYNSLLPDELKAAQAEADSGEGRSAGRGEYKKRELHEFVRCDKPGRVCAVMRRKGTTPKMQKALSVAAVHMGLLSEDVPAAALHRLFAGSGAAKVAHASTIGRAIGDYLCSRGDAEKYTMPRCSGVPDDVMREAWDALAQFDCGTQYSG